MEEKTLLLFSFFRVRMGDLLFVFENWSSGVVSG
jgi:hypothetical protein